MRKFLPGLLVAALIVLGPALGHPASLRHLQLWLIIAVGVVGSIFQPSYNPFQGAADQRDQGTACQIIWSIYLTQLAILCEAIYWRYPESFAWDPIAVAALALMLFGLALRSWGYLTLRQYFTWHISAQPDQPVIRTGPYSVVRHPGYLGAFLTYTATALFLHAWTSLAPTFLILLAAFLRRIHLEENELRRVLGPAYAAYCHEVKRFIPWIW